jgi:hypothetical protein
MLLHQDECPAQSINIWFKMMKDRGPGPFIRYITIFDNFLTISFESLRKYLPVFSSSRFSFSSDFNSSLFVTLRWVC